MNVEVSLRRVDENLNPIFVGDACVYRSLKTQIEGDVSMTYGQ